MSRPGMHLGRTSVGLTKPIRRICGRFPNLVLLQYRAIQERMQQGRIQERMAQMGAKIIHATYQLQMPANYTNRRDRQKDAFVD